MLLVGILSMVAAAIAFLVSEARIAEPLRSGIARVFPWIGRLLACGYCVGHWAAFGLVAAYQPHVLGGSGSIDFLLTALLVAWLAGFQWAAFSWLLKVAGK